MGKSVTHSVEFRDPIQESLGPDRYLRLLRCDDGSVYVFQKFEDGPLWTLRSRGSVSELVSRWSDSKATLPNDVIETMNTAAGTKNWQK